MTDAIQDAFDLYHQWSEEKRKVSREGPDLPALGHATAGSIGASISNLITYPLDLIITRLQTQRLSRGGTSTEEKNHEEYVSIIDAARKIYEQEGIAGLYTGAVQDTLKTAVDSFLFFFVYNSLRESRLRTRGRKHHLPVVDELGVGFIAGASAKLITMPIGTIVTRMQTTSFIRDESGSRKRPTVASIANEIRQEKGILGFWSGYSATLFLTLNPSLTFLFFENLKLLLVSKSKRSNPPPLATFLIAALSKAMASTITYPFSLAKARTQASRKSPASAETPVPEKSSPSTEPIQKKTNAAFQHTIIGTLLEIIHNEGISALYHGLEAEVLKGFFSHGITMLMKDAIHALIIKLYFAVLRLSKKYPSPDELKTIATQRASSAATYAKETADSLAEKTVSATESINQQGTSIIASATDRGKEAASYLADQTKSTIEYVADQSKSAVGYVVDQGKTAVGYVTDQSKTAAEYVTDQSKTAAGYVTEQGKSAAEFVGGGAGDLVEGARDLAGKIKDGIADQAAGIDGFVGEYVGDHDDDWDVEK